jgi:GNAT superfamily N-acetyltransferase
VQNSEKAKYMLYKITYTPDPTAEDINLLGKGIAAYATQQKGHEPIELFGFFIRDAQNKLQGGCNGAIFYGCLYVDQLYLEEALRKQGYGTQLIQAAEKLGKERGCTFSTVNTMDWEALGFYKKLGYVVEFTRRGYAKDSVFYFLRKDFC